MRRYPLLSTAWLAPVLERTSRAAPTFHPTYPIPCQRLCRPDTAPAPMPSSRALIPSRLRPASALDVPSPLRGSPIPHLTPMPPPRSILCRALSPAHPFPRHVQSAVLCSRRNVSSPLQHPSCGCNILRPSQNKCHHDICVSQTLLSLTRFVKILETFISLNKFNMKIDSTIYPMILICTVNTNIFLYIRGQT
jgi:hypothetical protein